MRKDVTYVMSSPIGYNLGLRQIVEIAGKNELVLNSITYPLKDCHRKEPGPPLNIKTVFPRYGDYHVENKSRWDRLIFNMGIPILVRWHLCIEATPGPQLPLYKSSYCEVSNIRRTITGYKIVDHSDVVGASPVGTAPTASSFST